MLCFFTPRGGSGRSGPAKISTILLWFSKLTCEEEFLLVVEKFIRYVGMIAINTVSTVGWLIENGVGSCINDVQDFGINF